MAMRRATPRPSTPRRPSPERAPRRSSAATDDELTAHVRALYRRIWAVARRIPRGKVATYGQVAELAGLPGGARVAGAAMRASASASARLPWQRVVGKRGPRRAGIALLDPVGAAVQRQRLEAEGVVVSDRGHIDLDRHGWLPPR